MAATSSTSSSDAPADAVVHGPRPHAPLGRPWALLIAIGIVAAVEIYLHTFDRMRLIAYASDESQYHAVRDTIDAQGAAEVALIGSSQMREGVSMPVLLAEVEQKMGRPVHVANYAMRGARLDGMNAVVRYLLRQPTPPRLIVVGVSQRDLRADTVDWPRVALFWDGGDWWRAFRRHGWVVTDVLPVMIRNEAGRVFDTLRYRDEIALTLKRPFARFGVNASEVSNPILGQLTDQNRGSNGLRSLGKTKMSIRRIFDRASYNYLFALPAKPRPAMRMALGDVTNAFAPRPAGGLLVQLPVASYLRDALDRCGQTKAFNATVSAAAAKAGVDYIPVARQSVRPTDDQFVDLQHLNRLGAEPYGAWLADEIAARLAPPPTSVPSR